MTTPTVKLRPLAESDLAQIYRHTQHQWGRSKATSYIRDLHQAFMLLAEHPESGLDRSDIKPDLRSYSQGSHVIFYRAHLHGILVVRVLHQAMDMELHL